MLLAQDVSHKNRPKWSICELSAGLNEMDWFVSAVFRVGSYPHAKIKKKNVTCVWC